MAVANNWNVVQYAVLLHMFAKVSGLKAGELVHVISDAHIYDRHIPFLEKMLGNEQFEAPEFVMNESVTDFYGFKAEDFELKNYNFTLMGGRLPVAI